MNIHFLWKKNIYTNLYAYSSIFGQSIQFDGWVVKKLSLVIQKAGVGNFIDICTSESEGNITLWLKVVW